MSHPSPQQPQQSLLAAHRRSGGFLGQTVKLLKRETFEPQTLEFAAAFTKKDTMALAQVLGAMEKMPRVKLQELLEQWRRLVADAMLVRTGMTTSPEAAAMGSSRTGADLNGAVRSLQKALDSCAANIGTGHICGWLLVQLR